MNWKRMKVVAAVPVALAVTAGAVQLGISYRNGNGFHPFGTDRKMKNNQILFPDSQESTGKQTDQTGEDDSSFLEKEELVRVLWLHNSHLLSLHRVIK